MCDLAHLYLTLVFDLCSWNPLHMQSDNPPIEPGSVYTLDEAAAHLRLTKRRVAKLARKHGLCMVVGRVILLTGSHIEGIKDTHRVEPTAPRRAPVAPSLGDYRLSQSLQILTAKRGKRRGGGSG
jgi:hypothetical protein